LKRETLDSCLSSALGVKLKDGKLQEIDDSNYVLTLEYTVKVCHAYLFFKIKMLTGFNQLIHPVGI